MVLLLVNLVEMGITCGIRGKAISFVSCLMVNHLWSRWPNIWDKGMDQMMTKVNEKWIRWYSEMYMVDMIWSRNYYIANANEFHVLMLGDIGNQLGEGIDNEAT